MNNVKVKPTSEKGSDVKYIRVDLSCLAAEREHLLNSDGDIIIGYYDGEDAPLLFPHVDNKHPATKHYYDALVIDVKTGQIINWKPYTEQELNDILEDLEIMRCEYWESGGDE